MTEKKTEVVEEKKSKAPLIGVIAVVALIAVGAMVSMSGDGVAESNETELSQIAPASSNDSEKSEEPMIKLGNPVVAVVNGEEIKRSDVFTFISGLPEQLRQMPIEKLFPLAQEQVVNNLVINTRAGKSDLATDPEVEQLVSQAKGQIVRNVFVERQIKEQLTQKKILKAYENLLDDIGEIKETKARHILLEDEAKAREVIAKLDAGGDFESLAKEYSTGPSADKGGDLGWFAKNEMVAAFSEAAFALEPGFYTKDPVKTQFGWHIIKVDGRRKRAEPQFETVKPQLETQVRQQVLNDLVTSWQKDSKIEKFDINGDKVKKN